MTGLILPESVRASLVREAVDHCHYLWPLIQGQQDPSKLDEANAYLNKLSTHNRFMYDIVMNMLSTLSGLDWKAFL